MLGHQKTRTRRDRQECRACSMAGRVPWVWGCWPRGVGLAEVLRVGGGHATVYVGRGVRDVEDPRRWACWVVATFRRGLVDRVRWSPERPGHGSCWSAVRLGVPLRGAGLAAPFAARAEAVRVGSRCCSTTGTRWCWVGSSRPAACSVMPFQVVGMAARAAEKRLARSTVGVRVEGVGWGVVGQHVVALGGDSITDPSQVVP